MPEQEVVESVFEYSHVAIDRGLVKHVPDQCLLLNQRFSLARRQAHRGDDVYDGADCAQACQRLQRKPA